MAVRPWTVLDEARVPGSGERIRLSQRGDEFSIRLGNYNQLMNSRVHASEVALSELGCAHLRGRRDARVLIGGLGMAFTLRAALDSVSATASVVVAELVPAVVTWNRGPLAPLSNNALADPRVTVREEDVGAVMLDTRTRYDAILIDVDNGPDGLHSVNDRLYNTTGLAIAHGALRPGGVYAVWSAAGDPGFRRRLQQTGFSVAEHTVHAHGTKGPRHTVWVATRQSR
jgi:spermidine synthase